MSRYPLILYLAIALMAGIILAVKTNIFILIIIVLFLAIVLSIISKRLSFAFVIILFLFLGFLIASLQIKADKNDIVKRYFNKSATVEGLVVRDVQKKSRLFTFNLKIKKINKEKSNALVEVYTNKSDIRFGNYIQFKGKIKRPLNSSCSKFKATIFIDGRVKLLAGNNLLSVIGKLRRWVKESLLEKRGDPQAFLLAMITGKTEALSVSSKTDLQAAGLAHLWAISGLHTGLVAFLIFVLLRLAGFRSGVQLLFLTISLLFFAAFSGFKAPVVRASIMVCWLAVAYLMGRRRNFLAPISAAAITTLAIDPASLFTPSFQLSYAAVISLFLFKDKIISLIDGVPLKFKKMLAASIAVQVLVMPLLAYYFGSVPIFSVFANILVLPIAAIAFYSAIAGLLVKLVGLNLLWPAGVMAAYILKVAAFFNSFYISSIEISPLLVSLAMILFVAALIYIPLPKKKYFKKITSVNFAPALIVLLIFIAIWQWLPFANKAISGRHLTVEFFDVGQGDASLVVGPSQERILIDAGPTPYKIEKHLRRRRIKFLDMAIASHADKDHIGGFRQIIKNFKVKAVLDNGYPKNSYYYRDFIRAVKLRKIRYIKAKRGQILTVGSLKIAILNPPNKFFKATGADDNNNSVVLKINYKKVSFLYTGDIGFEAEKELVKFGNLSSSVLKVSHHGSARGSSMPFLKAVRPKYAVISVGARNKYGHPKYELLKRLATAHAKIYRTDLSSDIKMVVNDRGLTISD